MTKQKVTLKLLLWSRRGSAILMLQATAISHRVHLRRAYALDRCGNNYTHTHTHIYTYTYTYYVHTCSAHFSAGDRQCNASNSNFFFTVFSPNNWVINMSESWWFEEHKPSRSDFINWHSLLSSLTTSKLNFSRSVLKFLKWDWLPKYGKV